MRKVQVMIWIVMLYDDVVGYHCSRGPCCLHLHPEDGGSKVSYYITTSPSYAVV
jgi:hypothetical protein